MPITFDPKKRDDTLAQRQLDFADSDQVFAGAHITITDDRHDYGEIRLITIGRLKGRMVVVVWTSRGDDQHVFSMRKANPREQRRYGSRLD